MFIKFGNHGRSHHFLWQLVRLWLFGNNPQLAEQPQQWRRNHKHPAAAEKLAGQGGCCQATDRQGGLHQNFQRVPAKTLGLPVETAEDKRGHHQKVPEFFNQLLAGENIKCTVLFLLYN